MALFTIVRAIYPFNSFRYNSTAFIFFTRLIMELSQINLAELKQLQEQVEKEIARKEKQERQQAVEEIYRIAHNLNMPLAELLSKRPKKAANSTTYLDPNNPNNKWEGRGPRPAWLKRAIADGAKLEDFRAN